MLKALAKNPLNRYQSAQEMRADALRAVSGRPVLATPVMTEAETMAMAGPPRNRGGATTIHRPMPGGMPPRPPERKTSSWVMAVLAALGVLAVVALGVGVVLSNRDNERADDAHHGGHAEAHRPDRRGGQGRARQGQPDRRRRAPPVETDDCPDTPVVAAQKPDPNAAVPADQAVSYQLCRGPERGPGPATWSAAPGTRPSPPCAALELKADFVEVDDARQEDQVIKVEKAGQKVKPGTTIKVTLSQGNLTAVPNVVDRTQAEAELLLSTAGFDVKVLTSQRDGTPGTVIDQDPNANQQRKQGTTVTITVIAEQEPDPDPSDGDTDPPGGGGGVGGTPGAFGTIGRLPGQL